MPGLHDEIVDTTVIYNGHDAWNAMRNCNNRSATDSGKSISAGLAKRLAYYARRRLADAGWAHALVGCTTAIEAHSPYNGHRAEDQTYAVTFTNPTGGTMGVEGIQILRGWPVLDHGMFLDDAD